MRLPTDGPSGEPLYAEAAVAGKKKDAVLECPLEACRMLDASGLLIKGNHHMKVKSTKRRIGKKMIFMTVMKTHSCIGLDQLKKRESKG